jgi:hypothetical protein
MKAWYFKGLAVKPEKAKKGINQLNNITCRKKALGDLIDFGVIKIADRQNINEQM